MKLPSQITDDLAMFSDSLKCDQSNVAILAIASSLETIAGMIRDAVAESNKQNP